MLRLQRAWVPSQPHQLGALGHVALNRLTANRLPPLLVPVQALTLTLEHMSVSNVYFSNTLHLV